MPSFSVIPESALTLYFERDHTADAVAAAAATAARSAAQELWRAMGPGGDMRLDQVDGWGTWNGVSPGYLYIRE